jgi:hypothetical protein
MRLATFEQDGRRALGAVVESEVVEIDSIGSLTNPVVAA